MNYLKRPDIMVVDNFCPELDQVVASAKAGGFGTWKPSSHEVGSGVYQGMGFMGHHHHIHRALCMAMNQAVFVGSMFFRSTNIGTEKAYVHSDRDSGDWTCITYCSDHPKEESGTGFYRHRKTGWREMPTIAAMQEMGVLKAMKRDMVKGGDSVWERLDFVRGIYNRALIFRAPLFHARHPRHGIGKSAEEGRIVHVIHFNLE